ncbi:MAG: DUF1858 domain-containing protein [Bacteroidales bacterium]|nr:DUF1858 domain-containing protein [Bacteroidales bacterium]
MNRRNEMKVNMMSQNESENEFDITAKSQIASLVKKYPYLREYLISLSPKFKLLKNPALFKTMGNIATIDIVARQGGFEVNDLINKLVAEIKRNEG